MEQTDQNQNKTGLPTMPSRVAVQKVLFHNHPITAIHRGFESQRGVLVPVPDGWVLVTAMGSARATLRKSNGWTEQTAEECLRIMDGDIIP